MEILTTPAVVKYDLRYNRIYSNPAFVRETNVDVDEVVVVWLL